AAAPSFRNLSAQIVRRDAALKTPCILETAWSRRDATSGAGTAPFTKVQSFLRQPVVPRITGEADQDDERRAAASLGGATSLEGDSRKRAASAPRRGRSLAAGRGRSELPTDRRGIADRAFTFCRGRGELGGHSLLHRHFGRFAL